MAFRLEHDLLKWWVFHIYVSLHEVNRGKWRYNYDIIQTL